MVTKVEKIIRIVHG